MHIDARMKHFFSSAVDSVAVAMLKLHESGDVDSPCFDGLALDADMPLSHLSAVLALSELDTKLLLLCFLLQYDGRLAALCQQLSNHVQPSLEIAANLLNRGEVIAFASESPLRYWDLLRFSNEAALLLSPLIIDEYIFFYLLGKAHLPYRLQPLLQPVRPLQPLFNRQQKTVQTLTTWLSHTPEQIGVQSAQVIYCEGQSSALEQRIDCEVIAYNAVDAVGGQLYRLKAQHLPHRLHDIHGVATALQRQHRLNNCYYLIEIDSDYPYLNEFIGYLTQSPGGVTPAAVNGAGQCSHTGSPAGSVIGFLAGAQPPETIAERVLRVNTGALSADERVQRWQYHMQNQGWHYRDDTLHELSTQFNLDGQAVVDVVKQLKVHTQLPDRTSLWAACRQRSRAAVPAAVRVIPVSALHWDDLVLPEREKHQLRTIVDHVRQRHQVYHCWGVAGTQSYGLGIAALFAGNSGTGKTFATRVLASALQLEIYQVDLSKVMDKYIGESEKKLEQVFQAAENSGAILLFDEADALFGKRTQVKEARDRYANGGVSYLLQRIEAYNGLSILTTNLKNNIDSAFKRRLRFMIDFPVPDLEQRIALWQRSIPAHAPQAALDFCKLASLPVGGGSINSIVVNSLFTAAAKGSALQMEHIAEAVAMEFTKAGKAVPKNW